MKNEFKYIEPMRDEWSISWETHKKLLDELEEKLRIPWDLWMSSVELKST